nr:hypothetical protein [Saprospiraceae bacterium]
MKTYQIAMVNKKTSLPKGLWNNLTGLTLVWLLLSLMMVGTVSLFHLNDYITHPQFNHFEHLTYFYQQGLADKLNEAMYYLYFIVDTLWPLVLVRMLYLLVKGKNVRISAKWMQIYEVLLATALLFDYLENTIYIFQLQFAEPLKWIYFSKLSLYGIVLVVALAVAYDRHFKENAALFFKFLKASSISILGLMVIVLLLTQMPQGSSLVIDLLSNPINLFFTLYVLTLISLIFSHHPSTLLFLHKSREERSQGHWKMAGGFLRHGIVYFEKEKKLEEGDTSTQQPELDEYAKPLRYFLGSLIYFAFLYILLFTYEKYIWEGFRYDLLIAVLFIAQLLLFSILRKRTTSKGEITEQRRRIWDVEAIYLWGYFLTVVALFGSVVASLLYGWELVTFLLVLSFLILRSFIEMSGRLMKRDKDRTYGGVLATMSNLESLERRLLQNKDSAGNFVPRKQTYIKWTGFTALLVLIAAHHPPMAENLNPILVLMLYLHIFYGILTILVKSYLYFNQEDIRSEENRKSNFKWGFKLIKNIFRFAPVVVILLIAARSIPVENLNLLSEREFHSESSMPVDTFIQNHLSKDLKPADSVNTRVYISSFGGGLRATVWNLLLMEKMHQSDSAFLEKIVAVSGVSGGALGQAFYFAIQKEDPQNSPRIISEIGKGNFLTTDLVYLLGADAIRKSKWGFPNRSGIAMQNYWRKISGGPGFCIDPTPFQTYWKKGFDQMGYYPALITNATNINRRYGIASSLYADENLFYRIFPYSTNLLLNANEKSLSFFDGVSTTERFPIFSATAFVNDGGHFVDGGYFENSGILSLMNLRKYINSRDTSTNYQDKLIVIDNDMGGFINRFIRDTEESFSHKIHLKFDGISGLGAVMKGAMSNFELPAYLAEYYSEEHDPELDTEMVYLPYRLRYSDITGFWGANPKDTAAIQFILERIENNNQRIDSAIHKFLQEQNAEHMTDRQRRWKFAYPSLSRLLSEASYRYFRAMMYHEEVEEFLDNFPK